mmetsp:Transcript_11246/g.19207  ORF Transcript_11246/g.19207 Transcript_11246/m.19207 type:complete len:562 (+) Transcript_11246:538-2223(+)|eukprot:CAMPEP_0184699968 /NCGR_PEP_ID=MMETSP0313-20130426/6778_1 /TAXON_ID=2792 /ORGANISM="Porphyridium aerugineum, Strain SAG 1380-2" /LENGTH=561 /DNA_ID=CAMNT_0027159215 /DNA_START=453 /DNA_END=2138 /DNA_ORIENTATION=+
MDAMEEDAVPSCHHQCVCITAPLGKGCTRFALDSSNVITSTPSGQQGNTDGETTPSSSRLAQQIMHEQEQLAASKSPFGMIQGKTTVWDGQWSRTFKDLFDRDTASNTTRNGGPYNPDMWRKSMKKVTEMTAKGVSYETKITWLSAVMQQSWDFYLELDEDKFSSFKEISSTDSRSSNGSTMNTIPSAMSSVSATAAVHSSSMASTLSPLALHMSDRFGTFGNARQGNGSRAPIERERERERERGKGKESNGHPGLFDHRANLNLGANLYLSNRFGSFGGRRELKEFSDPVPVSVKHPSQRVVSELPNSPDVSNRKRKANEAMNEPIFSPMRLKTVVSPINFQWGIPDDDTLDEQAMLDENSYDDFVHELDTTLAESLNRPLSIGVEAEVEGDTEREDTPIPSMNRQTSLSNDLDSEDDVQAQQSMAMPRHVLFYPEVRIYITREDEWEHIEFLRPEGSEPGNDGDNDEDPLRRNPASQSGPGRSSRPYSTYESRLMGQGNAYGSSIVGAISRDGTGSAVNHGANKSLNASSSPSQPVNNNHGNKKQPVNSNVVEYGAVIV